MKNSFLSWFARIPFEYDCCSEYCALDTTTNDEMRTGRHFIVNSLQPRADNIAARFGTESELLTGTSRLSPTPFAYGLFQLSVKLRQSSVIPEFQGIFLPEKRSLKAFHADRLDVWDWNWTVGDLQLKD
jgi:hypothetical protein